MLVPALIAIAVFVAGCAVLGYCGLLVWRQGRVLARIVGASSERIADAATALEAVQPQSGRDGRTNTG